MLRDEITPMILTYNEADNIGRTLAKLTWAKRILVIDSGSTDATAEIAGGFPAVEVLVRPFDSAAGQCNFGLTRVRSDWVLSLDADYALSDELVDEIAGLTPDDAVQGYSARFVYCVFGRPLSGTLYPNRTVLYRRARARYEDTGHTQRVRLDGAVAALTAPILHDDRKPLARWLGAQLRYAPLEATYLLSQPRGALPLTARIRRDAWAAPILVFFYTLIVRQCAFDGWAGWYYVLQRVLAECLIAIEIIDRRLRTSGARH